ncbi:hypothetical protein ScPMuIL_012457 [Solemya velum]
MMFSLAVRMGSLGGVLRARSTQQAISLIQKNAKSSAAAQMEQWEKANKIFYGEERDVKNFPILKQPEISGKVRLGFIPEEWFQFFYNKTGVTGPYLFGTGLVAFLLSKEILVIDHNFAEVIGFWGAVIIMSKKLGPAIGNWLDKQNEKYLFEAKKYNVALQLEAEYRKRLQSVYDQVKKRLDYQLELQNTKRQFEQEHMVNWIVQNVIKGITPQQEKDSIGKCIQNLRQLGKTAAV